MKTLRVLLIMAALLLTSCSMQHIGKPLPDRHERWAKSGYTEAMVKTEFHACSDFIDKYYEPGLSREIRLEILYERDRCMLGKGFRFLDPVRGFRFCDTPTSRAFPSCQSLEQAKER